MCTLDLEPEFLVEGDGGGVVRVDAQLDAREVQPVVSEVEHCPHQGRSYALALPVVAYCHADAGDVTHAPAGGGGEKGDLPDHLVLYAGHQRERPFLRLRETLTPHIGRRKRQLQGARYYQRAAEDAVQRFVVARFGAADYHGPSSRKHLE